MGGGGGGGRGRWGKAGPARVGLGAEHVKEEVGEMEMAEVVHSDLSLESLRAPTSHFILA